jgi:hypothetical protein
MMEQQRQQQQAKQSQGMQTGLTSLMNTPDGIDKIKELREKVVNSTARVADSVIGWDAEKRLSFFENFQDHPVLTDIAVVGSDPFKRIMKFIDIRYDLCLFI